MNPETDSMDFDWNTRSAGYRSLSHALLEISDAGLLKRDFLPKVARKVLGFSGCDRLELWVKEEEQKHYRCSISTQSEGIEDVRLVDAPLETPDPPVQGMFSVSDGGGFWTNDAEEVQGIDWSRLLGAEKDYRSYAVIPLKTDGRCVGLLGLKKKEKGFFDSEKIGFFEDISQMIVVALAHQYTQIELRERIKELTCLYGIAKVVARPNATFDEIIQGIVELLPPAWLYPDIASARIVLEGRVYATQGFKETPHVQRAPVSVDDKEVGSVEVAYAEKYTDLDEGAFLSEERSLIDVVAREVAHYYERKKAEEEKALLQDQLRHADRLATIGQLAAGVAHELNEPLGNILGFAQLAKKNPGVLEQTGKDIDKIVAASLHAREIIKKLMVFARQLPPKKIPVRLNKIVEDGLYFFEARCAKAGIDIVRDFKNDIPEITADPGQLNQVLVNLVVNALQAMPGGGTLTIRTGTTGNQAVLAVEDTGLGMTEEVQKLIFVPFFTTKDVDEGTGLGLPVVHGIVTSHKGSIRVESRVNGGSRFEIYLPFTNSDGTEEIA